MPAEVLETVIKIMRRNVPPKELADVVALLIARDVRALEALA